MKITPFLMSANKAMDYGPVAVAPDVLEFVAHARTDINETIPGVVRREVSGPNGKLIFFSRKRRAGEDYRDGFGRHILRVDGICVSEDPEGKFVFHPHYLEEAEKINDSYFEKFWTRTDLREGAAPVSEEIAFRPELNEHTEGVTILEPYEVPKKNGGAEPNLNGEGNTPGEGLGRASGRLGESLKEKVESSQEGTEVGRNGGLGAARAARRDIRRLSFHAPVIALGAIGIGLIGLGILSSFTLRDHDKHCDQDEKPRSGRHKPLRILAELGIGAGLTWAAYVHAQPVAGTRRLP